MKMKQISTIFIGVCMMFTSMNMMAFAEDAGNTTQAYQPGDLVWSEDFEDYATGAEFTSDSSKYIKIDKGAGQAGSSGLVSTNGNGNKYLKLVADGTTAAATRRILAYEGDAADSDGVFTVDVDVKLRPDTTSGLEYDMGVARNDEFVRSYFTITGHQNKTSLAWNINGTRNPASSIPKNTDLNKSAKPYSFTAWNTYRFIVRKYTTGGKTYRYADVYVNGNYTYKVGYRGTENRSLDCFYLKLIAAAGHYGEASIDNIKMYYGAAPVSTSDANGNSMLAKGVFTSEKIDFQHLTPGAISYNKDGKNYIGSTEQKSTYPIVYGAATTDYSTLNYEATSMVARRHNSWTTVYSAVSGKGGKSKDDVSFVATSWGPRLSLQPASDDSMRPVTYLHEGDSIEISADVMFTDATQTFSINPVSATGSGNNGITISPYWYAAAHFQDPAEGATYATNFSKPLPTNKWVNIKVVITRGTADTFNKLSIYCDNAPMVKDKDIDKWYANNAYTSNVLNADAQPLKGSYLAYGFTSIYLDGMSNYDNIEISRHLQTEFAAPAVPGIIEQTQGIVYIGTKNAADIITEYGVDTDAAVSSYVVRDEVGNDVDATSADGKYIAVKTVDGEILYIKLIEDKTASFEIDSYEDYEALGILPSNLVVAEVEGAYGKSVGDKAIKIEAAAEGDGYSMNRSIGSDPNESVVFEFSILPNETTKLNVGYSIKESAYWTLHDNKPDRVEVSMDYPKAIKFADGEIKADTVVVGNYKTNEWLKCKLYFDRNAQKVYMSVNGGEPKVVWNKKSGLYYCLSWVRFSFDESGSSAVLDDIKVYQGANPEYTIPSMTITDEISTKYFDNTISLPAYSEALPIDLDGTYEGANVPVSYIDANGNIITEGSVDKIVLSKDGIYTYYDVDVRDGITFVDNETEGKITAIVDGVNEADNVYNDVKLLRAVYNSDNQFVGAEMYDVPFEVDENGYVVNWSVETELDEYIPADGEKVKYFAWGMANSMMTPVCDYLQIK